MFSLSFRHKESLENADGLSSKSKFGYEAKRLIKMDLFVIFGFLDTIRWDTFQILRCQSKLNNSFHVPSISPKVLVKFNKTLPKRMILITAGIVKIEMN